MWHNVGLTLLVFVATLLIVLLLMVCGEWGASPRLPQPRALAPLRSGSGRAGRTGHGGTATPEGHLQCPDLSGVGREERVAPNPRPVGLAEREGLGPPLGIPTAGGSCPDSERLRGRPLHHHWLPRF